MFGDLLNGFDNLFNELMSFAILRKIEHSMGIESSTKFD
jgi:hypothetical protein